MSKILVIGAQNIDIFSKTKEDYILKDSNISSIHFSFGGVGRNITENLSRLDAEVSFLTVFGNDMFSTLSKDSLTKMNIDFSHSKETNKKNSVYLGILDKENDLFLGLNDMGIVKELDINYMKTQFNYINSFDILVIDNNLQEEVITYLLHSHSQTKVMDAVSAHKVHKLKDNLHLIDYLKLNMIELMELTNNIGLSYFNDKTINNIIITDQDKDILFYNKEIKTYQPNKVKNIVNASGAGDAFISGFIKGLSMNYPIDKSIKLATNTASFTLLCDDATHKELTMEKVLWSNILNTVKK